MSPIVSHPKSVASRQWDERRLAYPVDGQRKGTYLLTFFKADATGLKEMTADFALTDLVLRELILKIHRLLDQVAGELGMNLED